MKLILCRICGDVVRLFPHEVRKCKCGESSGRYTDELNAWYSGENAVPIGIAMESLVKAVHKQPSEGMGERFEAFVIPVNCPTFLTHAPTSQD